MNPEVCKLPVYSSSELLMCTSIVFAHCVFPPRPPGTETMNQKKATVPKIRLSGFQYRTIHHRDGLTMATYINVPSPVTACP